MSPTCAHSDRVSSPASRKAPGTAGTGWLPRCGATACGKERQGQGHAAGGRDDDDNDDGDDDHDHDDDDDDDDDDTTG